MRRFTVGFLAAGFCSAAALAQTPVMDGQLDSTYCQALAIQDTQTQFGNASQGLVNQASGSELDNAYAYVSGGRLYLFIGGNLESNTNDLEIFFDTRAGGQNRLLGNNPVVDGPAPGGLNRMGDDGSGNGLRFDTGFEADFYITVQGNNPGGGFTIRVNYGELGSPGAGFFCGTGGYADTTVGGALTGGDAGAPAILATINNSNILGVTGGSGVEFGGGDGVSTGIELSIPLTAIGSPSANFKACMFVNGQQHDFVSNQVLAGLFGGSNLGEPRNVNFAALAFDQFVTIPIVTPACGACCVGTTCVVDTALGCSGQGGTYQGNNASCVGNPCDTAATGACCQGNVCSIMTASDCQLAGGFYVGDGTNCTTFPCQGIGACCLGLNECLVDTEADCTTAGGDYLGGGTTCDASPCAEGACCSGTTGGTCTRVREEECLAIDGTYLGDGTSCPDANCNTGACCIMGFCYVVRGGSTCVMMGGTYQGDGTTCGPTTCGPAMPGHPPIDGVCETSYGAPLAVQNTQTQFGDSSQGAVDFANGSELDVLHAQIRDGKLYLCIAGNLESNFNKLEIFFDTRAGGQNRVGEFANPDVDFGSLQRLGDDGTGNGLRFDTGFDADFYITFGHGGQPFRPSTSMFPNYVELADGVNPGVGRFLGEGRAANYTNQGLLDRNSGGNNPDGIRITLNNSNTAGVAGGSMMVPNGGAGVTTGVEICVPLMAIGNPTDDFKVCLIVNSGDHGFMSNQVLGGIGGGGNFGDPRLVDFSAIPGDQCVTIPVGVNCGTCGDSNCSGSVTVGDIGFFVRAVSQGAAGWNALFPGGSAPCDFVCANDTNGDNFVTVSDIGFFVAAVTGTPCD